MGRARWVDLLLALYNKKSPSCAGAHAPCIGFVERRTAIQPKFNPAGQGDSVTQGESSD